MSLLDYVAKAEQVQIALLLAFCICFIGYLINRRIQKVQDYKHEEEKEQRRERFMALEKPRSQPPSIVEHDE